MPPRVQNILVIGGSDSSGCSGIQADIRAIAAAGGHALVAVTAVTAQRPAGVEHIWQVPLSTLEKQLEVALETGVDAVKTGMLPTRKVVQLVASMLSGQNLVLVVDPVLESSSGQPLTRAGVATSIKELLFPLASLATPNLPEASRLTGLVFQDLEQIRRAARELVRQGPASVLIKGGHDAETERSRDVFFDGRHFTELSGPRIRTAFCRGTGCTLAAGIAAFRAAGAGPLEACRMGKRLVEYGLQHSYPIHAGVGALGVVARLPLEPSDEDSP